MNLNGNSNAPCKQCTDRFAGCHAKCDKYGVWKNEINNRRKAIKEELNPSMCRYFKQHKSVAAPKSKRRYR